MLNPYNEYLFYPIVKETTARYLREAEVDHVLDQLNPRRPSWLAQQIRRAVHALGHVLIALGRRLDAQSA